MRQSQKEATAKEMSRGICSVVTARTTNLARTLKAAAIELRSFNKWHKGAAEMPLSDLVGLAKVLETTADELIEAATSAVSYG